MNVIYLNGHDRPNRVKSSWAVSNNVYPTAVQVIDLSNSCDCPRRFNKLIVVIFEDDATRGRLEWMVQAVQNHHKLGSSRSRMDLSLFVDY